MGSVLNSLDNMLTSFANNGSFNRLKIARWSATTTAATANSGSLTSRRDPAPYTMPSIGGGLSGCYFPNVRMWGTRAGSYLAAIEYLLGSITLGGAFADGVAMPTKADPGNPASTVQTATLIPMLAVTTVLVATNPVITITYVNQDGVGSRSAALTIPTNCLANSAFCIAPHLQAGDTGIQDVTNISSSAGSSGVLGVYGLLPIGSSAGIASLGSSIDPLLVNKLLWKVEAGDKLNIYDFGNTGAGEVFAQLVGVADN